MSSRVSVLFCAKELALSFSSFTEVSADDLFNKLALFKIREKLLTWNENTHLLPALIKRHSKLAPIALAVAHLQKFNQLSLQIVNQCLSDKLYKVQEAMLLDDKLITLQEQSTELVIAGIPFTRRLLKYCQLKT
jgi:hypothetical protein